MPRVYAPVYIPSKGQPFPKDLYAATVRGLLGVIDNMEAIPPSYDTKGEPTIAARDAFMRICLFAERGPLKDVAGLVADINRLYARASSRAHLPLRALAGTMMDTIELNARAHYQAHEEDYDMGAEVEPFRSFVDQAYMEVVPFIHMLPEGQRAQLETRLDTARYQSMEEARQMIVR